MKLGLGIALAACLASILPVVTTGTASAAESFPVKATLDGRTVKDPDVPVGERRVADLYPAGTDVDLVCQDHGPSYGGSDIWDLTTDGMWVPDAYVLTGSTGMVMPECGIPKSFPARVDLNGRLHKGDAADAPGSIPDKYRAGEQLAIDCQAVTDNGMIWDHTGDDLWVPDLYVITGIDGFVAGLPRCDTDGVEGNDPGEHGRNTGPAGPATGTNAEKVARVLDAARSQLDKGLTYAWGAGGMGGPSYGVHHYPDEDPAQGDDYERFGFDCSGLTLYAYWTGAGIDIGDWTGPQYQQGRAVPLAQRAPGDLVFWGPDANDPATTTHVAIYLGDDQILEASPPRDTHGVHVADLGSHSQPLPTVRRIIG
jgi:cell wall-associated NlpC family hydrolase